MIRRSLALLPLCLLLPALPASAGGPLARDKVPEPLQPWIDWAVKGREAALCPVMPGFGDDSRCAWPSRLELTLGKATGQFSQSWRVYREGFVPLPGEAKRWPQGVLVDGKSAPVTERGGVPSVKLQPGDHVVKGSFAWDGLPESIQIPGATGLLGLTVNGAKVPFPNRDDGGRLFLQKEAEEQAENKLEVVVHRQVVDDIPLYVVTHVELRVGGKNREELLGKALLPSFAPMSLDGPLPARLEPDGRLRVQVRPGTWAVDLVSRSEGPVAALTLAPAGKPWADEEVWVYSARSELRTATVEGVPAVDPQQTTLPGAWKSLPAYRMKPGETMKLVEKQRGDSDPAPDQLSLARSLWLDFDGEGFTAQDTITGRLHRSWRLTAAKETRIGRVAVNGRDQLITRESEGAEPGVEIRQGRLQVTGVSRIEGRPSDLSAVGWNHDFESVSAVLHLPPGWRLFSVSGADDVPDTWLKRWTLLDLFLVLIIALAIGRLFGPRWGVLALCGVGLTFPEADAPHWVWLFALAGEAVLRLLKDGWIRRLVAVYRLVTWVVLALLVVPFAVEHLRIGLHPALEKPWMRGGSGQVQLETLAVNGYTDNDRDGIVDRMDKLDQPMAAAEVPPPAPPPPPPDGKQAGLTKNLKVDVPKSPEPIMAEDKQKEEIPQAGEMEQEAKKALRGKASLGSAGAVSSWASGKESGRHAYVYQLDPNAMVQTGPGVPRWSWNAAQLRFSGPVEKSQRLHLWLLPPWLNLILAFLRIGLIAALVARLFSSRPRPAVPGGMGKAAVVAMVLGLALLPAASRANDLPSPEMLQDLGNRLTEAPDCLPDCAGASRLTLEVTATGVKGRLEVAAAATTAIALPGAAKHWLPAQVILDGAPAKGLTRTGEGTLWVQVGPGVHQLLLEGPLPPRESIQIPLPARPHRVEVRAQGWRVEGLHEDGHADEVLQLTRIRAPGKEGPGTLQPGTLPPFVRVERSILLGLTWELETRVVRLTPPGTAAVLEVPLLEGESITTADVRVEGGKALVNMAPTVSELSWHSALDTAKAVRLLAPKSVAFVEVWRVDAGPVWHVEAKGIPPIHLTEAALRVREWRPWPGEEVSLAVSRPAAVPGQTLTIDRATLTLAPGVRATDASLEFGLRASRGGEHVVTLPEGAELQTISVNGRSQPVHQDGRKVTVPVTPGASEVRLGWRETRGTGSRFTASEVDLGAPSANATVEITVPASRWTLFAGGPRLGPAILFWTLLLALLLVAIGLSRIRVTPLKVGQWVLLGLGLSQVPPWAAMLVPAWLLLLGWRKNTPNLGKWSFDLRQLLLVGWTVAAFFALFAAIRAGLLGLPDMQISGNGSTFSQLRWFEDRVTGKLPTPWVFTVPLLAYRLAMLAWALWIAAALLRWLRWGWGAFTTEGAWRRLRNPPAPPAPPAPPVAPTTPVGG